jgi:hypothetical protein
MIGVFGLEVSNRDQMLLDFEFGVFGCFAVSTNMVITCVCLVSLLLDLESHMFEMIVFF